MINYDFKEKVFWHEFGHVSICLLAGLEINYLKIYRENDSIWLGSVDVKYILSNEELLELNNLNHFCYNIFNYFAGSIFESIFLNKYKGLNIMAYDRFKIYRGVRYSDFYFYSNKLIAFKRVNNIYIEDICFAFFFKLENIFNDEKFIYKFNILINDLILRNKFTSNNLLLYNNDLVEFFKQFYFLIVEIGINIKVKNLISEFEKKILHSLK